MNATLTIMRTIILTLMMLIPIKNFAQNNSETVSSAINNYSVNLYKSTLNANDNILISPISSYIPLTAIYEGAQGKTQDELKNVLNIKSQAHSLQIDSLTKKITASNATLTISNAVWLDNSFELRDAFKNLLTEQFSAEFTNIDFGNPPKSASTINNWVADKTNNYIKKIISPNNINNEAAMILTNAIFFKGEWKEKFDSTLTKPDRFYSISKSKTKIDFMHQTDIFQYAEIENAQFISIPYKDNKNYFCILLPKKKCGIHQLEKKFNNNLLDSIISSTTKIRTKLSIPKFKLETECDLKKPLQESGINTVFTPQADLSGISDQKPLFISAIKHKTFISLNETKTIATGATAVSMALTSFNPKSSEPIEFKADHPFIFFIYNKKTDTILFIGRYVKVMK